MTKQQIYVAELSSIILGNYYNFNDYLLNIYIYFIIFLKKMTKFLPSNFYMKNKKWVGPAIVKIGLNVYFIK